MRFILILVAVAFLTAVAGCGKPTRRGGTLSGAATEASKPPEEQKTVVQRDPEPVVAQADTVLESNSYTGGSATAPVDTTKDSTLGTGVGFYVTSSRYGGSTRDRLTGAGLQLSFGRNKRAEVGLRGYITEAHLGDRGLVSTGLSDEVEFGAEGFFRYKLSPAHTMMSIYPAAGLRWAILTWSYTNPIQVSDGGDVGEVSYDYLQSFSAYAAIGAVFFQGERFQPEVEFQAGYRFYEDTTGEGFANDVFGDGGFFQLILALIIRLGSAY
jgi:hypothetical protein